MSGTLSQWGARYNSGYSGAANSGHLWSLGATSLRPALSSPCETYTIQRRQWRETSMAFDGFCANAKFPNWKPRLRRGIGMPKLLLTACEELLEIIMRRYERASIMLTAPSTGGRLGKTVGRRGRGQRHAGPLAPPWTCAPVRSAQLAFEDRLA
jgi:hypothetical protein